LDSPLKPVLPTHPGESCAWGGLAGSGRGLAIASAAEGRDGPLLIITVSSFSAQRLEDEIRFYASDLPILALPDWESLPYDVFSPHQDIISQRLETLYRLPGLTRGVVLGFRFHTPAPPAAEGFCHRYSFLLKLGDRLNIQQLREQLIHANYHNVSQVMEAGEFAIRAGS